MKELVHGVTYIALDTRGSGLRSSTPRLDFQDMEVMSFSGTLVSPTRYWNYRHSDTIPEGTKLREVVDGQGEWSALMGRTEDSNNHFLYLSDTSGFAPAFYSVIPGKAVILSDSFSGAVQGIRSLGGSLTLNLPHYVTLLSGKTATFQTLISSQTMANEIQILDYDKALYVGPETIALVDRQALSPAHKIGDYETALARGIESASQSIQTLVSSNPDYEPILTLTGGVDSRLILALLTETSEAPKFGVWSMDPRTAKRPQQKKVLTADVEIASELRHLYALNWMKPRHRSKISVSFEEALAHYQSFNSNFAFTFSPADHITIDEQPILTLRGGGGEVLRGTGGARIISSRYTEQSKDANRLSPAEWAAQHYQEQSMLTDETKALAQKYMTDALLAHPGQSFREGIDSYYRAARNRGHFGHLRKSEAANDLIMQVLANPFLIHAAHLTEYDYRISGRMVIDLFDKIDPRLREIPFETAAANNQLFLGNSEKFTYRNRSGWQNEFDALNTRRKPINFKLGFDRGMRGEHWDFVPKESSIRFIEQGFNFILDMVPIGDRVMIQKFQDFILKNVQDSQVPYGHVVAKVASVLDIHSPIPLTVSGIHYYTDRSRSDRIPPSNFLQIATTGYTEIHESA